MAIEERSKQVDAWIAGYLNDVEKMAWMLDPYQPRLTTLVRNMSLAAVVPSIECVFRTHRKVVIRITNSSGIKENVALPLATMLISASLMKEDARNTTLGKELSGIANLQNPPQSGLTSELMYGASNNLCSDEESHTLAAAVSAARWRDFRFPEHLGYLMSLKTSMDNIFRAMLPAGEKK